ncbi:MAG: hypothetical protein V4710_14055 [Verrucomicrobiota bacterium]
MSDFEPVSPSPDSAGIPSNVAATLACVSLVGGLVFLITVRKNAYVRFYSMQSLLLGCAWFVAYVVGEVTTGVLSKIPFFGKLLGPAFAVISGLVMLVFLVAYVIQIYKAFTGREWEVPLLGPMTRKQLSGR